MSKINLKKNIFRTTDIRNKTCIKEKTNIAVGIVNKIHTTLTERPYGKYMF